MGKWRHAQPFLYAFYFKPLANIHHFLTSALSFLVLCPLNGCMLLCYNLPLEKDRFGGNRKMWQNTERGSEVGEQHSRMEMLHKCLTFLMDRKDVLLPPFFIFTRLIFIGLLPKLWLKYNKCVDLFKIKLGEVIWRWRQWVKHKLTTKL
jgi:hypothetical protein